MTSVVRTRGATLRFDNRVLWAGLSITVEPGEFIAVLGGNGSGKTSLLRAILGLQPLSSGHIDVLDAPVRKGNPAVAYIPQQRRIDPLTPMRARDIVGLGLDGHRWGISLPGRRDRSAIETALEAVHATEVADVPVGLLSGGEQQRVRVAQALVAPRSLLLCDEPLLSLDPASQTTVTSLIADACHRHGSAALFVTHEIAPVVEHVDRVLYLAGGRFRVGPVDDVLTSTTLSELYGAPVEVVESAGRLLIVGIPDDAHHTHPDHAA